MSTQRYTMQTQRHLCIVEHHADLKNDFRECALESQRRSNTFVCFQFQVVVVHSFFLYSASKRICWAILCCRGKCIWSELVVFGQTFMTSSTSWLWYYHPYRDYKENSIQWLCLRGCNHTSHEGTDICTLLHSLC